MSPLPAMVGDESTMLTSPGMTPPEDSQGQAPTDPKEQARGAVELTSQIRTGIDEHLSKLEAIATQFPAVSDVARKIQQQVNAIVDQGFKALLEQIIKTTQMRPPVAPPVVR